jgi:diadenosine tetraphosphate (Ap4A) HIT family hydrolase
MTSTRQRSFSLNERIASDTVLVGDLALSRVLLMNDARFPWLVLVPRIDGTREVFELSAGDQQRLIQEIVRCAERLKMLTGAGKINIGALGNLVPQLHVHVVARSPGDGAWPGPVWGFGAPDPYTPAEADTMIAQLRDALDI